MKWVDKLARLSGTSTGARWVVSVWLVLAIVLSIVAPSAKQWAVSGGNGLPDDALSVQAQEQVKHSFPSNEGSSALLVFQAEQELKQTEMEQIQTISRWLSSSEKPKHVLDAVPLHEMPSQGLTPFMNEQHTTLMLPVRLEQELAVDEVQETVEAIRQHVADVPLGTLQFAVTGPAGIEADTISVFKNADFVLMTATVALILVLLLVMYRSLPLAVNPLLVAGVLYMITDRLLGVIGKNGWAVVEGQALSIMMILLFAVITDYCMFVFSRYREELLKTESQYQAMQQALAHVAEPVLFSAGTILLAVATLFVAVFEPYRHFAPVFVTAMAVVLFGGITLIPAVFALFGRRAFWPSIPRVGANQEKRSPIWEWVARQVTMVPKRTFFLILAILLLVTPMIGQIEYSFNLMKSFPETTSSRVGFEMLERSFPPGELAPVTVLVKSEQSLATDEAKIHLDALIERLDQEPGVHSVTRESSMLSTDQRVARLKMVLAVNPYDQAALDLVKDLRDRQDELLEASGFNPEAKTLLFSGQTPTQVDVRDLNGRDTVWVIALVIFLITMLLAVASRSLIAPLYMVGTILLTYGSTLGLTWVLFHYLLGYEAISYRIPLYAFVFIVALGVDYNLLLFTRIREEAQRVPLREAIHRGVTKTGRVITSAGLILVATFAVLITQPLLELKAFGAMVALGVLLDTFLVRGLLMPSLMMMLGRWNWWLGQARVEEKRKAKRGDQSC